MKNKFILLQVMASLCVMACLGPNDPGTGQLAETGAITGKAVYSGSDSHGGIVVTLEQTDGVKSAGVAASAKRSAFSLSITGSTITAEDGSFRFDDIAPGMYTIYAMSRNNREKAVSTNITVFPGQTVSAGELMLSQPGDFKGKVEIAGETGNVGVLVFVAGTSFMATTDFSGNFVISGVPANSGGYQILVLKGNQTTVWGTFMVSPGTATDLGTLLIDTVTEDEYRTPIFLHCGDMSEWLSKQQGGNTPQDPISVAYAGSETTAILYNALESAKKYIALDLSLSGYLEFLTGNELGRKYITRLVFPREYMIASSTGSEPAFKHFDNLESISGRAPSIGTYAFAGLTSLRSVSFIMSGMIGSGAFFGCTNLTSVSVFKHYYIEENAFAGCTSLITMDLPEVRGIKKNAFSGCTNLVSVNIPLVEGIESGAFRDCTSLTSIKIGHTVHSPPELQENIFPGAARTARVITLYVPLEGWAVFQQWHTSEFGVNKNSNYFWDKDSPYRENLTVALAVIH